MWVPWERVWWSTTAYNSGEGTLYSAPVFHSSPLIRDMGPEGDREREGDGYIKWWHATGPWGGESERWVTRPVAVLWQQTSLSSFFSLFFFSVSFTFMSLSSLQFLFTIILNFRFFLLTSLVSNFCGVLLFSDPNWGTTQISVYSSMATELIFLCQITHSFLFSIPCPWLMDTSWWVDSACSAY